MDHACHDYYYVALIWNVQLEWIYVDGSYIDGIGDDNLPNTKK